MPPTSSMMLSRLSVGIATKVVKITAPPNRARTSSAIRKRCRLRVSQVTAGAREDRRCAQSASENPQRSPSPPSCENSSSSQMFRSTPIGSGQNLALDHHGYSNLKLGQVEMLAQPPAALLGSTQCRTKKRRVGKA